MVGWAGPTSLAIVLSHQLPLLCPDLRAPGIARHWKVAACICVSSRDCHRFESIPKETVAGLYISCIMSMRVLVDDLFSKASTSIDASP